MSTSEQNNLKGTRSSARTIAVSIVVLVNIVLSLLFVAGPLQVLVLPGADAFSATARFAAPFLTFMGGGIIIASIGAWGGRCVYRRSLLAFLMLAALVQIWDSVAFFSSLPSVSEAVKVMTPTAWWTATVGVRGVIWVGLNYWCFGGSHR